MLALATLASARDANAWIRKEPIGCRKIREWRQRQKWKKPKRKNNQYE